MRHQKIVILWLFLVVAGCDRGAPLASDKPVSQEKVLIVDETFKGYPTRMHLVEAQDGHWYVVVRGPTSESGVAVIHAAGCKACKEAALVKSTRAEKD